MQTSIPVVAVFDIGKISKKFILFDSTYKVVFEKSIQFEESMDEDEFPCENLSKLSTWIKATVDACLFDQRFSLKALNFSTYGASLVHLDRSGIPVTPLYSYHKPYPATVYNSFTQHYGNPEDIAVETASPLVGMLNAGMQLFWLKRHKPTIFRKIQLSLHLPQFCSYLLTNRALTELTSIGCHTALWDFQLGQYHQWVSEENLEKLFPPIFETNYRIDIPLGKHRFIAGIGIHDDSAALVPFLLSVKEPFLVLSTNTFNTAFNPFNNQPLTADELNRDCLSFINFRGKPVKASRLLVGSVLAHQESKIVDYFGHVYQAGQSFKKELALKLLRKSLNRRQLFFLQEPMDTSRLVAQETDLGQFESYEEAYYQLYMEVAAFQAQAIELITHNAPVRKLFITGTFRDNAVFTTFLALRFPEIEVYTVAIQEAAALGAALIMHAHWNAANEIETLFECKRCEASPELLYAPFELT